MSSDNNLSHFPCILYHYIFHVPPRLDDRTETTEGTLETGREPGFTGPIWNDFCEPDGVLNSVGVGLASRSLLAELVVEPPMDGPSYDSFPTGNAIMPNLCAADPAADDFLPDLTEPGSSQFHPLPMAPW